jgi:hypothetical protein
MRETVSEEELPITVETGGRAGRKKGDGFGW